MIVFVSPALLGTPFADFCTQSAVFGCVLAFSGGRLCAQQTDGDTLTATVRTVVVTLLINHGMQTRFARSGTAVTGFNTGLMGHGHLLSPGVR